MLTMFKIKVHYISMLQSEVAIDIGMTEAGGVTHYFEFIFGWAFTSNHMKYPCALPIRCIQICRSSWHLGIYVHTHSTTLPHKYCNITLKNHRRATTRTCNICRYLRWRLYIQNLASLFYVTSEPPRKMLKLQMRILILRNIPY